VCICQVHRYTVSVCYVFLCFMSVNLQRLRINKCNGEKGFGVRVFHGTRGGHTTLPFVANLQVMVPHKYSCGERERDISSRENTINNSSHMSHSVPKHSIVLQWVNVGLMLSKE
jgi:hypothetical protein